MLNTYRFTITLTLRSPVLSQSMHGNSLGIDTTAWEIQKGDERYPALPGSLIRGNLLHSWKLLSEISNNKWMNEEEVNTLLGHEAESKSNKPNRALICTSENWVAKQPSEPRKLHRIHIDSATGAVEDGMLQTLQISHPVGKTITYEGWMEVTIEDGSVDSLESKIYKGLDYISALGAFKGIGFGELLNVEINKEIKDVQTDIAIQEDSFGLALSLDRPFCFAKPHPVDSNRFESLSYIPGGAIKGAIANRMDQMGNSDGLVALKDNLHLIRFTHALAAGSGNSKRSASIPLSLYLSEIPQGKNTVKKCFDASMEQEEETIKRSTIHFQSDWKAKDWNIIEPVFLGYENTPEHTLRVRTAIDEGSNAAKEEALFSIEAINTDEHVWLTNVSLVAIKEEHRENVKTALQRVLSMGLNGLGKTNSQTRKIALSEKPYKSVTPHGKLTNSVVCMVLQSDALLISADRASKDLKQAYTEYWSQLSGGSLIMTNFFASQSLYGGDYYWRRFCSEQDVYNPLLLTNAGSVFVFKVVGDKKENAEQALQCWIEKGLPQSGNSDDWKLNPLLAENGYGEVLINPSTSAAIQKIKGKK